MHLQLGLYCCSLIVLGFVPVWTGPFAPSVLRLLSDMDPLLFLLFQLSCSSGTCSNFASLFRGFLQSSPGLAVTPSIPVRTLVLSAECGHLPPAPFSPAFGEVWYLPVMLTCPQVLVFLQVSHRRASPCTMHASFLSTSYSWDGKDAEEHHVSPSSCILPCFSCWRDLRKES